MVNQNIDKDPDVSSSCASRSSISTLAQKKGPIEQDHAPSPEALVCSEQQARRLDFPYEILTEIALHSSLNTVLSLAFTCKMLFDLLSGTSEESKSIWASAGWRIGLPSCPPDMTPFTYAQLLCNTACMICDSQECTIDIRSRTRFCHECKEANMTTGYDIVKRVNEKEVENIGACRIVLTEVYNPFITMMNIEAKVITDFMFRKRVFLRHVAKLLRDYLALDSEAREKFATERRQYIAKLWNHENSLTGWILDMKVNLRKSAIDKQVGQSHSEGLGDIMRAPLCSEASLLDQKCIIEEADEEDIIQDLEKLSFSRVQHTLEKRLYWAGRDAAAARPTRVLEY